MNAIDNTIGKGGLLDELELAMTKCETIDLDVTHTFTPGLYIRQITIPAGTILTSMTHKYEHPFVISQGRIMVTSETEGSVIYEAPHTGITKPATRRALRAETDVIWTTFHVTEETDVEKICNDLLEPHVNPLIEEDDSFIPGWRQSLPNKPIKEIQS